MAFPTEEGSSRATSDSLLITRYLIVSLLLLWMLCEDPLGVDKISFVNDFLYAVYVKPHRAFHNIKSFVFIVNVVCMLCMPSKRRHLYGQRVGHSFGCNNETNPCGFCRLVLRKSVNPRFNICEESIALS